MSHLAVLSAYVRIRQVQFDGSSKTEEVETCQEFAPGVKYCEQFGKPGLDLTIIVHHQSAPPVHGCRKSATVKKSPPSVLLLHHVGKWSRSALEQFTPFFAHTDFTEANATRMGVETLAAWDRAVDGLCEGQKVTIQLPPLLGFDDPEARLPRPAEVPRGATLLFEVEVIKVLFVADDGHPYRPCFFSLIDADSNGHLDRTELVKHFARIGRPMPSHVMSEDKDGDGWISFAEFTGPKIAKEKQEEMALKQEL